MFRNLINLRVFAKIPRNVKSRHYSELVAKKTENRTKKLIPENRIKKFNQPKIKPRKTRPPKKLSKSLIETVANIIALVVLTYIFYPFILLVLFVIISKLFI